MRLNYFLAPPRFSRYVCYPDSFGHYYDDPSHGEYRAEGQLHVYNWHIVRAGKGYLRQGKETIALGAGTGFLYAPGTEQSYYADSEEPWDVRWVHFDGWGIDEWLQGRGEGRPWIFSWAGAERLDQLWGKLLELGVPSLTGGEARLSAVLYEMLMELMQHAEQLQGVPAFHQRSRLVKAAEWIRANCDQQLTLEWMADAAGYSVSHFTRQFNQLLGQTPIAFLTECRIVRAKILLVSTALSVKRVAEQSGFSSSAYFIQRFRKSEGVTPEQFRQLRGM